MSEQHTPSLQFETSQTKAKTEDASASTYSSASDEKSTSSNPTRRRKPSSMSPSNNTTSSKSKKNTKKRQKVKSSSQRGGHSASRGSVMMPGLMGQGEEITYTPTTHRISKAKKGKKVHACEYPGCQKIFTRAEHRKRHEANHNTSPAFQCEIEGCRKPFQRADLLARHMERQHNMPSAEASAFRSQYRQSSNSEVSSPSGRGSISAPHVSQSAPATASSLPHSSGTMSIGSIIEPNLRGGDHKSEWSSHMNGPSLHELPHAGHPIGTAPRHLAPEIIYGLSPSGESPFYTSSSDSCYSPLSGISDQYLQPQTVSRPYYSQEMMQRSQSSAIECFQPVVTQSPLSGPATPSWNQYEHPLSFVSEQHVIPSHPRYQFQSPSWAGASAISPYETNNHAQSTLSWNRANDHLASY